MSAIDCCSLHAVFVRQNLFVTLVGVVVPRPCVGKRLCLGAVLGADVVVYLVVVAFGIERRIDITKINRLVTDKLPHHIKIVAVKEFVHGECSRECSIYSPRLRNKVLPHTCKLCKAVKFGKGVTSVTGCYGKLRRSRRFIVATFTKICYGRRHACFTGVFEMTINEITRKLNGVRKSQSGFIAECPAHDDKKQSLSIGDSGGKVLLNCFAGCPPQDKAMRNR